MIMECTQTRKPAAKLTMSATTDERTHSFAVLEPYSISAYSIAITGTRLIVESQANITAQTLTWAAHNQSLDLLKHHKLQAQALNALRSRPLSTDRSTFKGPHPLTKTPSKSKKPTR